MDLHREPFDPGTQAKLDLYRDYVREWLPVFLGAKKPWVDAVQIFDFFAGPGRDSEGNPGSPIIAVEELKPHWDAAEQNGISVSLFLNEFSGPKFKALKESLSGVAKESPRLDICLLNKDFTEAFGEWIELANREKTASLIFLDQNGMKQITPDVFRTIVQLPTTDFLFFISSSYIYRFRENEDFTKYIDIPWDEFKRRPYCQTHRTIFEWYKSLLPAGRDYYLAPFSIKKGANIYGLIFGSGHVRGMDKFLRRAWALDHERGEANFDIDGDRLDPAAPALFEEMNVPKKLQVFERDLRNAILSCTCRTNSDVYLFALSRGCLGKHAQEVYCRMREEGLVADRALHVSYNAWHEQKVEPVELL